MRLKIKPLTKSNSIVTVTRTSATEKLVQDTKDFYAIRIGDKTIQFLSDLSETKIKLLLGYNLM